MEHIDLTPNTRATFQMLLVIVKNGKPSDAVWAEKELMRYADWLDKQRQPKAA